MPRYMIQTSANSGWTDTEVVSARHAGEALRKHRVASFIKGQKRAIPLPMATDYKPNEGLNTPINVPEGYVNAKWYQAGNRLVDTSPAETVDLSKLEPADVHRRWYQYVDSRQSLSE